MPVAFDTRHHLLESTNPDWEAEIREQHDRNREAIVARLRYIHGEANLEKVIQNVRDLGSDPFSTIGWHLHLWAEVRHAFLSGAYFPAAVGAGALAERILNHLLIDLAGDSASDEDQTVIQRVKAPTYGQALRILKRWQVLEPEAVEQFDLLRNKRNNLIHFSPEFYSDPRGQSLDAVTALRDALDSQFGVLVQRRLIPGTPGAMYARKEVESEPFFKRYMAPVALHVSPRHRIDHDPATNYWIVSDEEPVETDADTDEEFVRHLYSLAPEWQSLIIAAETV